MTQPNGPQLLALFASLFALASIVLLVRIYARWSRLGRITGDEIAAGFAWLLSCGCLVCAAVGVRHGGWCQHMVNLSISQIQTGLKAEYAYEILYHPASQAIRTSILLLYRRINTDRHFTLAVDITLGTSICAMLAAMLTITFQCWPVAFFWTRASLQPPDGRCLDGETLFLIHSGVNLVFDLVTLALPIPMVWRLRTTVQKKLSMTMTFSLGILACMAAAARIYYTPQIFTTDPFYTAVPPAIWGYVEIITAIVCASLPALRTLSNRGRITVAMAAAGDTHSFGSKGQNILRRLPSNDDLERDDGSVNESMRSDRSSSSKAGAADRLSTVSTLGVWSPPEWPSRAHSPSGDSLRLGRIKGDRGIQVGRQDVPSSESSRSEARAGDVVGRSTAGPVSGLQAS